DAEMHLVDINSVVTPRVAPGNDAAGRRKDRSALGHAEARRYLRDRDLNGARDAVRKIGRRHRAAERVPRNADDAIFPQVNRQAAEGAGIGRDRVIAERIENADQRRAARGAFREIETAGQAIGIVTQVNLDTTGYSIYR